MLKKTIAMLVATMTFMTSLQFAFANVRNIDNEITIKSISFLKDQRNEKEVGQLLTNGKTYEFPIIITDEKGDSHKLKDEYLDGARISIRAIDGKEHISSISAEKDGSSYNLVIKPKAGWPTEQNHVSYNFVIMSRKTGKTIAEKAIDFSVGYEKLSDDAYANVKKGDFVNVNHHNPVITKKQFESMDKLANGDAVTFSNSNWRYEVKVNDQKTLNLLNHKNPQKTLMSAYPDQEFEFFNFPAGSEFDYTGTMTFDVADLEKDFGENFYTYRYYKGKMIKINATYDKQDGTITFRTKWLGNFVLTNKEIKDGTMIEDVKGASTTQDTSKPNKVVPTGALA